MHVQESTGEAMERWFLRYVDRKPSDICGLLQQATTESDCLMRAIVVAGEPGQWPAVSYRDRQYSYEVSTPKPLAVS